jgi:hypothetical protein
MASLIPSLSVVEALRVLAYTIPQTGTPHTGVCAKEYQQDVLPRLLSDGKTLFKNTRWAHSWMLQQDYARARPHVGAGTNSYLEQHMRGRLAAMATSVPQPELDRKSVGLDG